jgi:hypothetical protein
VEGLNMNCSRGSKEIREFLEEIKEFLEEIKEVLEELRDIR